MPSITIESHFIKPHSVAGQKVKILTRHPETPHPKKDSTCEFPILHFKTQDNTRVEVLETTQENCLGDAATQKAVGSLLNGKQILICSNDRRSLLKPKIINLSGTHKTHEIITNKYTYCELHVEYSHILKKSDYDKLHKAKIEIVQEVIKNTENTE